MTSRKNRNLFIFGAALAYFLIGIEIVIMISPFALYFYSVYGPILDFFAASPLLSWSTEFFLPHMVFLDDPLILGISYLQILLVIGLVLFFSAAVPLYYSRFRKKGLVRISFYAMIRHPQYLFLAISGFGLLLYWPRFIILVMYVTMLFVYYVLARNEEWRMQDEAPAQYAAYMANTPMFLPGEPGGRLFAALFGWIRPKWLGILTTYLLAITLSLTMAMGIRAYTVSRLPIVHQGAMTLLPVFPRPVAETKALYRKLADNPLVRAGLADLKPNLAYIFPGDYFLTAIVTDEDRRFSADMIKRFPEVLEWHQDKFRGGLGKFFRIFYNFFSTLGTVKTNYDIERVVFVSVKDRAGVPVAPAEVFALGMQREPVLIVDLDAGDHRVLTVSKTSPQHKWGGMPMPTF